MDESQCRSCSPGFYCSGSGLSAVSGPCLSGQMLNWGFNHASLEPFPFSSESAALQAFHWSVSPTGFFCLEGSQTATPISNVSGGVCPTGHFCTEGTYVPSPCPAGSFRNETGGKGIDDCKPCQHGKQLVLISGQQTNFNFTSPNAFSEDIFPPKMSLLGWFQDLSGQRECHPCPPGFDCRSLGSTSTRGNSAGDSSPMPCPAGYVCPRESLGSEPLPCPRGTYSPKQGLTNIGNKQECFIAFKK